jgi:hypothetical protein
MWDALMEMFREPIAEMEAAGLTSANGWYVDSALYAEEVVFRNDATGAEAKCMSNSQGYRWNVCAAGIGEGLGLTLAEAIKSARRKGVPL